MNKNIIVVILAVLLVASVGWGVYLWQGNAKLQTKVKTLESDNSAMQNKIAKGLAYAKSFDSLLEPVRRQSGLPTRQTFSSEADWLSAFAETVKATADTQLLNALTDIKAGGNAASRATILFMDHAVSAIVDVLK